MQKILDYTWEHPTLKFYFLIDAAKEYRYLRKWIRHKDVYGIRVINLFQNTIDKYTPAEFSPLLVNYQKKELTQEMLSPWLYRSAILNVICTEASEEQIFKHLQSYLSVKLPDGKNALFRFFDPSVAEELPVLLNQSKYTQFMNPINSWWYVNKYNSLTKLPEYKELS